MIVGQRFIVKTSSVYLPPFLIDKVYTIIKLEKCKSSCCNCLYSYTIHSSSGYRVCGEDIILLEE